MPPSQMFASYRRVEVRAGDDGITVGEAVFLFGFPADSDAVVLDGGSGEDVFHLNTAAAAIVGSGMIIS